MEENINIFALVLDELNKNDMWFTTKADPTAEEASSYYKLNEYGEPTEATVKKIEKEVTSLIGDGAVYIEDAVELWVNDALVAFKIDYKDNLVTQFEDKPVVDNIEAYENPIQFPQSKKIESKESHKVRVKIFPDIGNSEEIEIEVPNDKNNDEYITKWLDKNKKFWNEYKILDESIKTKKTEYYKMSDTLKQMAQTPQPTYIAKCTLIDGDEDYDDEEDIKKFPNTYLLLNHKNSNGMEGTDVILEYSPMNILWYNCDYGVEDLEIVKQVSTLDELIDFMKSVGEDLSSMRTEKGIAIGMDDMMNDNLYRYVVGDNESDPELLESKKVETKTKKTEGAGAGYHISGTINVNNINSFKVINQEEPNKYGDIKATVECNIDVTLSEMSASSYYYGNDINVDVPAKVTGLVVAISADDESNDIGVDEGSIKELLDGTKFKTLIGGGWTHTTFTGDIQATDSDIADKEYYFSYFTEIDIQIPDENIVKYIDKVVEGENFFTEFVVYDQDGDIISGEFTAEETDYSAVDKAQDDAIEFAKANRGVRVVKQTYRELADGDLDGYDTEPEVVWEREYNKNYKFDDEVEESKEVKTENNKIPRNWKKITYKSKIDTNVDKIGDTVEVERDEWNRPIATNLRTGKTAQVFLDMIRNDELAEVINIETEDEEVKTETYKPTEDEWVGKIKDTNGTFFDVYLHGDKFYDVLGNEISKEEVAEYVKKYTKTESVDNHDYVSKYDELDELLNTFAGTDEDKLNLYNYFNSDKPLKDLDGENEYLYDDWLFDFRKDHYDELRAYLDEKDEELGIIIDKISESKKAERKKKQIEAFKNRNVNFNKRTKEENYQRRLDEVNNKSKNLISDLFSSNDFDSDSPAGQIVMRTSEMFNALSDKGYDVEVTFDNGESTSAIQLGQQGGKVMITITNTNQPLRAFTSGNFEINDQNIKILQDIQSEIEVL